MQTVMRQGLARSSLLVHKSGVTIKTPLLIPAFASKGFRFKGNKSEASSYLKVVSRVLEESCLISAYDVFYKHIQHPRRFPCKVRLLFLDSGGYETSDDHDLSAIFKHTCPVKSWDESKYKSLLTKWPKTVPTVIVSYDHGNTRLGLKKQILNAHNFFSNYPNHLHDFLIKPEKAGKGQLNSNLICAKVSDFKDFHIIGLTEKELGTSILQRMTNIAKIRLAMDAENIDVPIHIFGCLDPLTTCLYFLAGAEIFDGLTWLRYGYLNGQAVYYQNYQIIENNMSISENQDTATGYMLFSNLRYLRKLRDILEGYLVEGKFSKFGDKATIMKNAYDMVKSELNRRI